MLLEVEVETDGRMRRVHVRSIQVCLFRFVVLDVTVVFSTLGAALAYVTSPVSRWIHKRQTFVRLLVRLGPCVDMLLRRV